MRALATFEEAGSWEKVEGQPDVLKRQCHSIWHSNGVVWDVLSGNRNEASDEMREKYRELWFSLSGEIRQVK